MSINPLLLRVINPRFFLVGLLLLSVAVFIFLNKEKKSQQTLPELNGKKRQADLSIQKFHYTEREKGERKWEVWAERAQRYLGSSHLHMDQVTMELLLDQGGWVQLSGRNGDYFEKEERVELAGEVKIQSDAGYTLYAERLTWETGKNLIRSEEPVRLVTSQYMVKGEKMSYRTDLRQLSLAGGVHTVFSP